MKILFFGTPTFSVPALRQLLQTAELTVNAVFTQPDRPAGRGGIITAPPIKQVALEHGIPVFQPASLKREFSSMRASLAALGPFDVGVVVAFGQLLPSDVLAFPKAGCVNIHASLLPRWRGAAPIQRAIESGDSETGVCLMRMDEGLDTGDVYTCARVPITETDTAETLHDSLALLGGELLVNNLRKIVEGSLQAIPQPTNGVTYAAKITTEECEIDWSRSAVEIARKIRAFAPHPGCFTTWHDQRMKVFKAHTIVASGSASMPPGSVVPSAHNELKVQCGEGVLSLNEIQLEGKKRMSAEGFLRGRAIPEGSRLGTYAPQK